MGIVDDLSAEKALCRFVTSHSIDDTPEDVLKTVKAIALTVAGTSVAGANEEGVGELRDMLLERGGRPEATVIVFGDRLPALSAALLNSVMARALDYCDAMVPGAHFGSSVIPTALAASEVVGKVSGRDFLAALTVGFEVGSRVNLPEQFHGGRDPTGVAGMFSATATAARILGLTERQTMNAFGLALNRCGGSIQSNVDASLAVRLIQGWVSEASVECALLARRGFTGPIHFLDGIFGYSKLFARGELVGHDFVSELGSHYALQQMMFKRYPSCGLTQGVTDLALRIAEQTTVSDETLVSAEIRLPSFAYRIVGGAFRLGATPRVNAQFSAQFCAANAWARGASMLEHFRNEAVNFPSVMKLIERIKVVEDHELNSGHQTAVVLEAKTKNGTFRQSLDVSPGFPPNKLSADEHKMHFVECMRYAPFPLAAEQISRLPDLIASMESLSDVGELVKSLTAPHTNNDNVRQKNAGAK